MSLLSNPRPVIVVVGVGAVGGFYAARLIRANVADVHLLLRGDYDAVRANGLQIRSFEGDFTLPPEKLHVHRDPAESPKADLVLVALKATGNAAMESLIRPLLKEDTIILTLQNGLGNEDRLAELFGVERVLGGMAFVCIHRIGPGVIHHIDHGFVKIGEFTPVGQPPRGQTPRLARVAELFRSAGIRCDILDDLRRGRWDKLVWNIPFNSLGAALDLSTDRLINSELGVNLVTRIMNEVAAIAAAEGCILAADVVERQLANTRTMGAYQSSMQVDRRQGRALEVEAILGEPLHRAKRLGVPTPTLDILYQLLRLAAPGKP